ncbi:hypothetical protein HNP52_002543 [Sphingomonas kyeonggiensis]|uniref:PIN like domain-containing protein n=1 Tax=Sphingomonas kyeonggiensis TaxID=1268553 RepID=A0A7W7K1U1_9SPHN|nr:PIN domain-containing protein [Sphingomonas kyeonggiensis]MBB4839474.1 hypothetical protein [Sphingomonas kyeonggiensis]
MSNNDGPKAKAEPINRNDAFWLTDLYPDASALFRHQQASLADISKNCLVILDANVLLWPFELGAASVEDIAKVYKKLAGEGRLLVPGQAAREFYKHRSRKVAALTEVIDGAITRAKRPPLDSDIPLLSNDADYIAAKKFNAQIVNAGKGMAKRLAAASQKLKDEIGSDRVSLIYRNVLSDCVIEIPDGAEERKAIIDEAEKRARLHIAPGYKDQHKEDGGLGDLIIWMTILQVGRERKLDCIFVSNEEKADWWVKSRGAFQPRPELIEEYRRNTEGRSIHFLPLSALLANFEAAQETVSEVQKLEEVRRDNDQPNADGATKILSNFQEDFLRRRNRIALIRQELRLIEERMYETRSRIDSEDIADQSEWDALNDLKNNHAFLSDQLKMEERNNENIMSGVRYIKGRRATF